MKCVYLYDENTKLFTNSWLITDDANVPANSTEIEPINKDGTGMYDPRWDGEKWVGKTYEEWNEDNPEEAGEEEHTPNDIEQAITALSKHFASAQEQLSQLQKTVTAMSMNMDGDK